MPKTDRDCVTCEFFVTGREANETNERIIGHCRRLPPMVHISNGVRNSAFPKIWKGCWCGDYEPAVTEDVVAEVTAWAKERSDGDT